MRGLAYLALWGSRALALRLTLYKTGQSARMLSPRARFLGLVLGAVAGGAPGVSTGAFACGIVSGEATVQEIAPRGEIVLADGRHARFGGLWLSPRAGAALAERKGRQFEVATLDRRPDRWGRLVVDLVGRDGQSVALDLILRGLALVRPEPETRACEAERLQAEEGARAAGEGVWANPAAILDSSDQAALASADGRFALVEGVVRRVGETRTRVYLDFAGRQGFSVVIPRKAEAQFRRAGVDLKALAGQRVLVRGVVDVRFGPRIEIADPLMIEPLDR
jgi:micrococcal nuclease